MPRLVRSTLLGAAFLAGAITAPLWSSTGCRGDGEPRICDECKSLGWEAYRCWREFNVPYDFCHPSGALAELECFKVGGYAFETIDCSTDDEAGYEWPSGWPASEVTEISAGVYTISQELEVALRDDWSVVLNDEARFSANERGYFQIDGVAAGDLWSLLGYQSGDVFLRVNGIELAGFDGLTRAYESTSTDTRFVIEVQRGTETHVTTVLLR